MKTMYKQVFLFCLIVCAAAFHAASGTEPAKPIPASLDEAGTYEEIMAYANHIFDQYKNWKTEEDFDRFLENYPPCIGKESLFFCPIFWYDAIR